ncbi:MAG: Arc family DNA-binding protein [Moorea sp. SIO2I5]|nr:Arc family DNA-binding protein [Moorena sp. SIO2I5]
MTTFTLRDIPEELYQQIKDMAAREGRSVNQQILVLLERSVRLSQRPPVDVLKGAIQTRSQVR